MRLSSGSPDANQDDDRRFASQTEPRVIRLMRFCLNYWPFRHGKGILLRRFGARLRRRDFLIEIEPGVLIPGDLDDWIVLWYFAEGARKNLSLQLSRSLIRPGDTLIDVGANIGLWVMGAATQAGDTGRVHAFEPVSDNFVRLKSNLTLNHLERVVCQELALSDKSGRAVFYVTSSENSGLSSLQRRQASDCAIETEVTTLDDYSERANISHIDFMKVDVEGAELLVFRGGHRLLTAPDAPVIMFETDEVLTSRFASSSRQVKSLLHEYGYNLFRYDGRRLGCVEVNETHQAQEDLFAFKPYHFQKHAMLGVLRNQ